MDDSLKEGAVPLRRAVGTDVATGDVARGRTIDAAPVFAARTTDCTRVIMDDKRLPRSVTGSLVVATHSLISGRCACAGYRGVKPDDVPRTASRRA